MKYLEHNVHHVLFTEDYTCREVDPGLSAHSRFFLGKGEEESERSAREREREIALLLALPKQAGSWELPTAGEWAEMKS